MTNDEIKMIQMVIRTSSNCPKAQMIAKYLRYDGQELYARIPNKLDAGAGWVELKFESFIPDVEVGADAAARMLMYMGLETYPLRAATFFDYIQLAYEFGKQNRWN